MTLAQAIERAFDVWPLSRDQKDVLVDVERLEQEVAALRRVRDDAERLVAEMAVSSGYTPAHMGKALDRLVQSLEAARG